MSKYNCNLYVPHVVQYGWSRLQTTKWKHFCLANTNTLKNICSTSVTCKACFPLMVFRFCVNPQYGNICWLYSNMGYNSYIINVELLNPGGGRHEDIRLSHNHLVRFKSDPLAAFMFRSQRGSDPMLFEITGWTEKKITRSYRDTVVKTTALTTIIFITKCFICA